MAFGENPFKVQNIVAGSLQQFYDLYVPLIKSCYSDHIQSPLSPEIPIDSNMQQDSSPKSRMKLLQSLPSAVLRNVPTNKVEQAAENNEECAALVRQCLAKIIKQSSAGQTVKGTVSVTSELTTQIIGLITAGVPTAIQYAYTKVSKFTSRSKHQGISEK